MNNWTLVASLLIGLLFLGLITISGRPTTDSVNIPDYFRNLPVNQLLTTFSLKDDVIPLPCEFLIALDKKNQLVKVPCTSFLRVN